jgi:hypothetical protein
MFVRTFNISIWDICPYFEWQKIMANKLKKTRTITDKVSVKGTLSDDGTVITYLNEDKNEETITIAECLNVFKGKSIDFSVILKSESDIPEDDE